MNTAACDDLRARFDAMAELASHAAGQAASLLDELAAAPLPEDEADSERMVQTLAAGLALVGWCADEAASLGGRLPSREGARAWLLPPGLVEKLAALPPLAPGACFGSAPAGRLPEG